MRLVSVIIASSCALFQFPIYSVNFSPENRIEVPALVGGKISENHAFKTDFWRLRSSDLDYSQVLDNAPRLRVFLKK